MLPELPNGQTYKDFQTSATDAEKSNPEYGKLIAQHVDTIVASDHFLQRNHRFALNRQWASGDTNMKTHFANRFGLGGTKTYVNLNWKALKLVNTIISRVVGRWMARKEKISVTATDTLSITQKNEQYEAVAFELQNRKMLAELEESSGVTITPKDQFRPDDQEHLELWRQEIQKLPEEILYQTNSNDAFAANGWDDVLKEEALTDSAEVGLVGTYTWMDEQGVIHVDPVKPENAFYSHSEYADFRDTTIRGQIKSMKITELRRRYAKQFKGEKGILTEEEIFEIAGGAKEYQASDKQGWTDAWTSAMTRPYDDWNVDVLDYEVKTINTEGYTIRKNESKFDGYTFKSTRIQKGAPKAKDSKAEYVEDKYWVIYRGVAVRTTKKILEWGLKKNMIRPQDPKEMGNCEFSYSFYMYQPKNMRNVAIPEKIEAAVEQLISVCFKMEHILYRMRPPGSEINVDAIQELDIGMGDNGKKSTEKDVIDMLEQRGDLFYRGRDAEGKPIPAPIREISNAGFMPQMQALIELYRFWWSVLKDELGEDPNLISQAATPRVSQGNIQAAQQMGEYATDYMYNAYIRCMEETAKKMACLMHMSVKYGAKAYRDIFQKESISNRVFGTKIKLLPTIYEIQDLKAQLQQAIASTPDLVIYLDTFKVLRIAQEDIKLAEMYYRQAMKNMLVSKQEQASRNQQETIQGQIESAKANNEGKAQIVQLQQQLKLQEAAVMGAAANRTATLTGILKLYELSMQTGQPLPPEVRSVAQTTLETVALSSMLESEEARKVAVDKMRQDVEEAQAIEEEEQMQASQQEPPLPTDQPQEQMQPEMAAY